MTTIQYIPQQRLFNQRLTETSFERPDEVVRWMGAVQSQDYGGAKWAVGLRLSHCVDANVEQAFTDGLILRTHVMRPTWHFVTPDDIRWLLMLTAPRVHAAAAYGYRQAGLDESTFSRSNTILANALQGGSQLSRPELAAFLQQNGIATDDLRLTHLMMHAELDGIICSGARRGKQHTYALLDERAPQARRLNRDEALAELTLRYFTSHGPATPQDFVWWSGLTMTDARAGLETVRSKLEQESIDGQIYWMGPSQPVKTNSKAYLLPNYDEYMVGYSDRSAIFKVPPTVKLDPRTNGPLNNTIVIDGQIVGTWKRTIKKDVVVIEPSPFAPLTDDQKPGLADAARAYGQFFGLSADLR